MERSNERLDLEKLRAVCEIAIALLRDQDHIFEAYTADAQVIQSGLYGDHMALTQGCFNGRDPRRLMDIQAQAMSRAVKKTLHSPFDSTRWKTSCLEQL